ncbi:MAG: HEAT repeat domain-containing protein [Nitrospiraceae bacterium]
MEFGAVFALTPGGVFAAGMAIVALAVVILAVILTMRLWLLASERRRTRFVEIWKPLLAESLLELPQSFPPVRKADTLAFLYLWTYFQESVRGDSHDKLNQVARLTGADVIAKQLLTHGSMRVRLIAVTTLGHLHDTSSWDALKQLAAAGNSFLALASARALVHIDPRAAMPIVIPLISSRSDWSPVKVVSILNEAGAEIVAMPLAHAVVSAPPEQAVRIIRCLEATRSTGALPVIREMLLGQVPDDRVIPACLHLFGEFGDPKDLSIVRTYVGHAMWPIRVQAAAALGRMGTEEDEDRLIDLLVDEQWWVRYRAAEALARLSFISRDQLVKIQDRQTDPRAKEVLRPFLLR